MQIVQDIMIRPSPRYNSGNILIVFFIKSFSIDNYSRSRFKDQRIKKYHQSFVKRTSVYFIFDTFAYFIPRNRDGLLQWTGGGSLPPCNKPRLRRKPPATLRSHIAPCILFSFITNNAYAHGPALCHIRVFVIPVFLKQSAKKIVSVVFMTKIILSSPPAHLYYETVLHFNSVQIDFARLIRREIIN